jgi:ABC-type polysaccharide transport system permease subunit
MKECFVLPYYFLFSSIRYFLGVIPAGNNQPIIGFILVISANRIVRKIDPDSALF